MTALAKVTVGVLTTDAAPADPQQDSLTADAQLGVAIDHRLALGNRPTLPSAPDKKSFSSANFPDLGMQGLDIHCRFSFRGRSYTEHTDHSFQQLIAPMLDLVRMDFKILGQLDQILLGLDRQMPLSP